MYPPSGVSPSYNPSPPPDTGVERGGRQEGHPELSLCQVRARRWQGTDRAATRLGLRRAPAPAEPTPRRRGLAVTAWGEVRAGPGDRDRAGWGSRKVADAVTLVPKPCSSARGPHASLDARGLAAAFQLLYGAALQPGRALPSCAHSRLPSLPPTPPNPSLPLSTLLPFILTLLGRPVEVASWIARAATLKSSEPVLGRASRPDPGQRPPKTRC